MYDRKSSSCSDSLASHADMEDKAVPLDRIPVVKIDGGTAQLIGPIPKEKAALKICRQGVNGQTG